MTYSIIIHPSQASSNVLKAIRTIAIKYSTTKQPYIAAKSNGEKWYIDTKTSPQDGYLTPQDWIAICTNYLTRSV